MDLTTHLHLLKKEKAFVFGPMWPSLLFFTASLESKTKPVEGPGLLKGAVIIFGEGVRTELSKVQNCKPVHIRLPGECQ